MKPPELPIASIGEDRIGLALSLRELRLLLLQPFDQRRDVALLLRQPLFGPFPLAMAIGLWAWGFEAWGKRVSFRGAAANAAVAAVVLINARRLMNLMGILLESRCEAGI